MLLLTELFLAQLGKKEHKKQFERLITLEHEEKQFSEKIRTLFVFMFIFPFFPKKIFKMGLEHEFGKETMFFIVPPMHVHMCKYVDQKVQLPCWPPRRDQQVLHQRQI